MIFFRYFVELPAKYQPLLDYFWDIRRDWERLQRMTTLLCKGYWVTDWQIVSYVTLDVHVCSSFCSNIKFPLYNSWNKVTRTSFVVLLSEPKHFLTRFITMVYVIAPVNQTTIPQHTTWTMNTRIQSGFN